MKEAESEIVADGARRLRKAKDYAAAKRRITLEIQRRHEEEMRHSSFWQRLWLRVKISREVHAELNKEFPPAALHLISTAK